MATPMIPADLRATVDGVERERHDVSIRTLHEASDWTALARVEERLADLYGQLHRHLVASDPLFASAMFHAAQHMRGKSVTHRGIARQIGGAA